VEAGANALHVHPRQPDGSETLDPEWADAVVAALREACPGTPVGLTTGLWATGGPAERLEAVAGWRAPPDFASVNVSEPGLEELCGLLAERGIGVEAGVWSLADAEALAASDAAARLARVLVEVQDPQTAVEIDGRLVAAGVAAPQLHHGEGIGTWAVLAQAVEGGRDIRVGLEDTLVLPDGRTARDNAELVAEAKRLADRRAR
jgi:uncharacterized protein (DUF849 family)